jgi:hypothetical protein
MIVPVRYTTTMLLAAEQNTENPTSGQNNALGGLGAAASLLSLRTNPLSPDLEKFRVLFVSPQTASIMDSRFHLLQKRFAGWNQASQRWDMPPLSLSNAPQRLVRWMFGRPLWRAPTAGDLAEVLSNQISIQKSETDPFLIATTTSDDPKMSEQLLYALTDAANGILRERAQRRAVQQIDYLSQQLQTISNAVHRQVLIELLSSQEQVLMLSRSDIPYAAQILTPPTTQYDQPQPGVVLTLLIGVLVGLVIGVFAAFFREALGRSRGAISDAGYNVSSEWPAEDVAR